jgi:hypothetical protein
MMANRVMEAKFKKLRAQRRRYPRRMDLDKRGPRPNKDVIAEYSQRAKTIGDPEPDKHWTGAGHGTNGPSRAAIIRSLDEKRQDDKDALNLLCGYMDNMVQHVWFMFNAHKNAWEIHQYHKRERIHRISRRYGSMDDAIFVLRNEIVDWLIESPDQVASTVVNPPRPLS